MAAVHAVIFARRREFRESCDLLTQASTGKIAILSKSQLTNNPTYRKALDVVASYKHDGDKKIAFQARQVLRSCDMEHHTPLRSRDFDTGCCTIS